MGGTRKSLTSLYPVNVVPQSHAFASLLASTEIYFARDVSFHFHLPKTQNGQRLVSIREGPRC